MGHHYVPQRYLRNFEDASRPGSLWLYDKAENAVRSAAIKSVAQAKKYYPPEIETQLANEVEVPGSAVIEKLINKDPITTTERFQLSFYIGTMFKRVPRSRRKAKEMFPAVRDQVIGSYRATLQSLLDEGQSDPALIARRMSEVEELHAKYSIEPPDSVLDVANQPWPSGNLVLGIFSMTWRIITTPGPVFFITSDNPASYFESLGIGRPESELTFPLSRTHALHGSWQGPLNGLFHLIARQKTVREVNRRLVSTAERLVFYHRRETWLRDLVAKPNLHLSLLRW